MVRLVACWDPCLGSCCRILSIAAKGTTIEKPRTCSLLATSERAHNVTDTQNEGPCLVTMVQRMHTVNDPKTQFPFQAFKNMFSNKTLVLVYFTEGATLDRGPFPCRGRLQTGWPRDMLNRRTFCQGLWGCMVANARDWLLEYFSMGRPGFPGEPGTTKEQRSCTFWRTYPYAATQSPDPVKELRGSRDPGSLC